MFETLKTNFLMSTTLFADKNIHSVDTTMDHEFKSEEARKKFLKDFAEGYYKNAGAARAARSIELINAGTLYFADPIFMQDDLANQDNVMLAIAAYLAENAADPSKMLRRDYLSNKFIIRLNKACEYLGFAKYVPMTEEDLKADRVITFDDPDYTGIDKDAVEAVKGVQKRHDEIAKWYETETAKGLKEAADYNEKLKKDALKELAEEKKKKEEKEAKKAKKKAEKEAKKAKDQDTANAIDAEVTELDNKQNGAQVFKQSRGRAAVTKGINSAGTTNNSSASSDAGKGGNGKTEDSSDSGDPDPAASNLDLDAMIPPDKLFPIIEVTETERDQLLAQNELERIAFIRANGGQQLKPVNTNTQVADTNNSEIDMRRLFTTQYDTGRFCANEIGHRADIQLIQDAVNEVCKTLAGTTASVTPAGDIPDQYMVMISYNGMVVDEFVAYGSRIMGNGVPCLLGNIAFKDKNGAVATSPYFVPIHSPLAIRENIFRKIEYRNINGELNHGEEGTYLETAINLNNTICKDFRLFDHIDLSTHPFNTDEEAHAFFHVLSVVLNNVHRGIDIDDIPRYRIARYRNFDEFDLFGDALAYGSYPPFRAGTFEISKDGQVQPKGLTQPKIVAPDGRRIVVAGNKIQVIQPDGKTINLTVQY